MTSDPISGAGTPNRVSDMSGAVGSSCGGSVRAEEDERLKIMVAYPLCEPGGDPGV